MTIIETPDPWALPLKPRKRPDRVTVYRSTEREPGMRGLPKIVWRYKVQDGGNWRTLAVSSEAYTKRAHCVRMARRLFPEAELVVEP